MAVPPQVALPPRPLPGSIMSNGPAATVYCYEVLLWLRRRLAGNPVEWEYRSGRLAYLGEPEKEVLVLLLAELGY